MDNLDIVEIYSAANPIEAHALANALEAAGIKAEVVGDYLGVGSLPLDRINANPKIWVRKEDETRARELLKEFKAEHGETELSEP